MKFQKIYISEEITKSKGLKSVKLTEKPLGNVIALVGQNGAGKSRILKFIESYFDYITPDNFLEGYICDIPKRVADRTGNALRQSTASYNELTSKAHLNSDESLVLDNIRKAVPNVIASMKPDINSYIKVVSSDEIKKIKNTLGNNLTFETILKNPITLHTESEHQLNEFTDFTSDTVVDFMNATTNRLGLEDLNLFVAQRNSKKHTAIESESSILYRKFQKHLQNFLGKEISYQVNDAANIATTLLYDDHVFNLVDLSPGERTLFAYAMLFFYMEINSTTTLGECIVIVDEPELHLHPKAQIHLLNSLRNIISDKGQLWIATHSVHMLSHLSYDEIFMVKNNEIITPSRIVPGDSLIELMGIEGHIEELQTFINSTSEWAYANFMIQCFKDPEVLLNVDTTDPQYILFKKFISSSDIINMLDFGAGRGRIGCMLQSDKKLMTNVNYSALEINESFHQIIKNVERVQHVFSSTKEIQDDVYDLVLLCNVLHEIPPEDWINEISEIKRILKNDGYILIIEDKNMPKGENAHRYGYLVLNPNQLRLLFNTDDIIELESDLDYLKGRFTFCAIAKEDISPTPIGLTNALLRLKMDCYNQIANLREQKMDVAFGRKYANLTQQYINSCIALDEFSKEKPVDDFFVGVWRNEWVENDQASFEFCTITSEGKYYVDEKYVFDVLNVTVDKNLNTISFIKKGINQNEGTLLLNELNIVDENFIYGIEKDVKSENKRTLKIYYTRQFI